MLPKRRKKQTLLIDFLCRVVRAKIKNGKKKLGKTERLKKFWQMCFIKVDE